MFPLLSNLNLKHDFDYHGQNLNYIFSNNFQNLKTPTTIYSTSTLDNFKIETTEDLHNLFHIAANSKDEIDLICDDKEFSNILLTYLNSILKNTDKENIEFFKQNYILDLELKSVSKSRFNRQFKDSKILNFKNQIYQSKFSPNNLKIESSNLPFVFLLANWINTRQNHEKVIEYVKFFCWNLLFGEFEVFIKDACIDYYSRDIILPKNGDKLLTDSVLRHNLKFTDDIDYYIAYFKSLIDLDNAKELIHRYFKNTRDNFYVESYDEPLELIYAGEYEQLLIRDLEGPFKIVYATDELWDTHVTTLLSYVYNSFRKKEFNNLKRFELRDLK
jgi:hypothetical protein